MDANVNKYLEQQVMTASPAKLVFMLYEKAIGSLHETIAAIEAGNIEGRWRANSRATDIITHMWCTLDLDEGGEISDNLSQLYAFMLTRLSRIDFDNDADVAREVIGLLEPLRDSWMDLARNGGVSEPQPAGAPEPADRTASPVAGSADPVAIPAARTNISA